MGLNSAVDETGRYIAGVAVLCDIAGLFTIAKNVEWNGLRLP